MAGKSKYSPGMKFSKLTLLQPMKVGGLWWFKCDCGVIKLYRVGQVASGHSTSCGCGKIAQAASIGRQRKKDGGWYTVIKNVMRNSRGSRREELQLLGYAKIKSLLQGDCHYCGISPNTEERFFNRNGIDRIDNNVGYIESNIVSCCSACNFMKGRLDQKTFVGQALRIAEFQQRKQTDGK